ncbi:anthranilate synthase alpha subunit 2, chloroplastic-like isoform X2 [Silene latifolia]|uniref:anthranilate synthase alpha subunit 2, chloroplastic-like isoform X2 n=1 Tax=Silene latifolia TaxID=37657 RepID=UPI003D77EF27
MMEKQLLNDQKQCAEQNMFFDLGRNDVGKVSKFGYVKIEKLMNLERVSHVMHISSTIGSDLKKKIVRLLGGPRFCIRLTTYQVLSLLPELDACSCWEALDSCVKLGRIQPAYLLT